MMHQITFSGRRRAGPVLLPLFFSMVLAALPAVVAASESCSMMSGTCRDACGAKEQAEAGDFEDCGPKQECCTARSEAQCCVLSFSAKDFGPANCRAAGDGGCLQGSANASPCAKLPMCATVK